MTGGNASSPASLEAWAPTPQQEHNLQLLELVVKLREALLGIPAMITPQDGKGTGSGGADSAKILAECRDQVADAVEALDESASDVILEPYLSGVSDALETIVAKMHRCVQSRSKFFLYGHQLDEFDHKNRCCILRLQRKTKGGWEILKEEWYVEVNISPFFP